jgi:hypothetical protein
MRADFASPPRSIPEFGRHGLTGRQTRDIDTRARSATMRQWPSALRRRRVALAIVMCGRFTNRVTWEELVRLYRLTLNPPPQNTRARYNVCPTDPIPTIIERDGKRECIAMRWGLVPYWWSKPLKELRLATFNARVETVTRSRSFASRSSAGGASSLRPGITNGRTRRRGNSPGTSPRATSRPQSRLRVCGTAGATR